MSRRNKKSLVRQALDAYKLAKITRDHARTQRQERAIRAAIQQLAGVLEINSINIEVTSWKDELQIVSTFLKADGLEFWVSGFNTYYITRDGTGKVKSIRPIVTLATLGALIDADIAAAAGHDPVP